MRGRRDVRREANASWWPAWRNGPCVGGLGPRGRGSSFAIVAQGRSERPVSRSNGFHDSRWRMASRGGRPAGLATLSAGRQGIYTALGGIYEETAVVRAPRWTTCTSQRAIYGFNHAGF